MRLFSAKIAPLTSEIVAHLRSEKDIETDAPAEVEKDIASVLLNYIRLEQEASEQANDLLRERNMPSSEFSRFKRLAAEKKGIKLGEEALDFILDQIVEMLMHSENVEEVFAADHVMKRHMAPFLKKHMAMDIEMEQEVRGRLKHMREGTSTWEVEYQRVMGEIKRRKGV